MDKIEELHLVDELLKKHNLPISPILKYALKEKEESYLIELGEKRCVREEDTTCSENCKGLEYYCDKFANLSVGVAKGKKLPHKAIMLLAIMCLIENGVLNNNCIELNNIIANEFVNTWNRYIQNVKVPSVWTPFWYLKSESFWHFKAYSDENLLKILLSFAGHPSIGQMRNVIRNAYLDEQLFSLMQDKSKRFLLSKTLIDTYIK